MPLCCCFLELMYFSDDRREVNDDQCKVGDDQCNVGDGHPTDNWASNILILFSNHHILSIGDHAMINIDWTGHVTAWSAQGQWWSVQGRWWSVQRRWRSPDWQLMGTTLVLDLLTWVLDLLMLVLDLLKNHWLTAKSHYGYHVGPGPTYVGPGPTYVGPGPYADMYVINWTSEERKVYGVIHVIHFFHLGPIPDTKNSSISPLGWASVESL